MRYYPVFLDLRDRPCVVIGGGQVAERKAVSLLEAGADVTIVSPSLTPHLTDLVASGKVQQRPGSFNEHDLDHAFLAIAATNDHAVNRTVARLCRKKGVLVNVAAPPEESSFIVPSVVERGDLLIAVSTCGSSPVLSHRIRKELEERYGPVYDVLLSKLAALRKRLQEEVGNAQVRKRILEAVIDSDVLLLLQQGKLHEADLRINELVRHGTTS